MKIVTNQLRLYVMSHDALSLDAMSDAQDI
jgi:hypothetical protein